MEAAKEDAAVIGRLYADHGHDLFRFCFRLSGDADRAEDLCMETLLAGPASLRRFQRRSSVRTWLFRMALNKWRERSRKDARLTQLHEDYEGCSPPPDGDLAIVVEQAMAKLSPVLLEAFVLVRLEGMRYREAAKILDIPIGTVQSRVHAATEVLRVALGPALQRESA